MSGRGRGRGGGRGGGGNLPARTQSAPPVSAEQAANAAAAPNNAAGQGASQGGQMDPRMVAAYQHQQQQMAAAQAQAGYGYYMQQQGQAYGMPYGQQQFARQQQGYYQQGYGNQVYNPQGMVAGQQGNQSQAAGRTAAGQAAPATAPAAAAAAPKKKKIIGALKIINPKTKAALDVKPFEDAKPKSQAGPPEEEEEEAKAKAEAEEAKEGEAKSDTKVDTKVEAKVEAKVETKAATEDVKVEAKEVKKEDTKATATASPGTPRKSMALKITAPPGGKKVAPPAAEKKVEAPAKKEAEKKVEAPAKKEAEAPKEELAPRRIPPSDRSTAPPATITEEGGSKAGNNNSSQPQTPTDTPRDIPGRPNEDMGSKRTTPTPVIARFVSYPPGQWTPSTTSKPKVYSRQFLMEFKAVATTAPTDMRSDMAHLQQQAQRPQQQRVSRDRGGGVESVSFLKGMGMGRNQRGRDRRKGSTDGAKRRIEIPTRAEPLKTSENRWVGGSKNEELDEEDKLLLEVNAMLNKLTLEKFDKISDELVAYGEKVPEEKLKDFTRIVFDKPCDQPFFSNMYARLCKKITGTGKQTGKKGEKAPFGALFKQKLIELTREEFSTDRKPQNDRMAELREKTRTLKKAGKKLSEEEEEEAYRLGIARSRNFANIKFIGELYKLDLVAEKTIHNDCLAPFLKDDQAPVDLIECLATLLSTAGAKLDATKSKERQAAMNSYFEMINAIIKRVPKLPSRAKFMLQDLCELRMRLWEARREDAGPKTINEIHNDAKALELKKARAAMEQQQNRGRRQSSGGSGGGGGRAPRMTSTAQDGWSTVPTTTRRERVDVSKLGFNKLQSSKSDDDIKLGPGAGSFRLGGGNRSGGWGAAKGGKPDSKAASRKGNQFELLIADEHNKNKQNLGLSRPQRPTPPPSASAKKEASSADDKVEENAGANDGMADATIEQKVKGTIDEYMSLHDEKEAVECLLELPVPRAFVKFVQVASGKIMDCPKDKDRALITRLAAHLAQLKHITGAVFATGIGPVFEELPDTSMDAPLAPKFLAEMVAVGISNGVITLKDVSENKAAADWYGDMKIKFILHVLSAVHRSEGADAATAALNGLGGPLVDCLPEDRKSQDTVVDLCDRNNLSFLLGAQYGPKIAKVLADGENVSAWIETNVAKENRGPALVATLTTEIMKAVYSATTGKEGADVAAEGAEEEKQALKQLSALMKFTDGSAELQLHAVCAAQAFAHSHAFPKDLLDRWFNYLYDNDVVPEEVFTTWETDNGTSKSAAYPGKGAALRGVAAFFDRLKNGEEEDDSQA